MQDIRRIMCVVDPTASAQPAFERSAWLAGKLGAELELFICYYNEYLSGERLFDSPSLAKARAEIIGGHRKRLEEMAEPLRSQGLTVRTDAVWDHPLYEGIIRHAAATGADIVFKDTHYHGVLNRAFLSNTDWNLIRSTAAPLWLVKPHDLPHKPVFVAAVDPMHENDKPASLDDRILSLAAVLAEHAGGELRAFHSYDPRMAVATATANAYIPASLPFGDLEEQVIEDHRQRFTRLTEKHGLDEASTVLVPGLVHDELPAYCREIDAGVVVMGAVSRNRLQRLFVGATAERTLDRLPCDLLIVKPDWAEAAADISPDRAA